MRTTAMAKTKATPRSLTDHILTLCASGRFGVREAIAEATKRHGKRSEQPPPGVERQKVG